MVNRPQWSVARRSAGRQKSRPGQRSSANSGTCRPGRIAPASRARYTLSSMTHAVSAGNSADGAVMAIDKRHGGPARMASGQLVEAQTLDLAKPISAFLSSNTERVAFISYVHEDHNAVDHLQRKLEAADITVWRDLDQCCRVRASARESSMRSAVSPSRFCAASRQRGLSGIAPTRTRSCSMPFVVDLEVDSVRLGCGWCRRRGGTSLDATRGVERRRRRVHDDGQRVHRADLRRGDGAAGGRCDVHHALVAVAVRGGRQRVPALPGDRRGR